MERDTWQKLEVKEKLLERNDTCDESYVEKVRRKKVEKLFQAKGHLQNHRDLKDHRLWREKVV